MLSTSILIPDYARTVVERLEHFGYEAYVVGGCVRDSLLGRAPKDWDVCTNATPQQVLGVFKRFNVIKTGLKHGTVTVMVNREPVEVTTFRVDGEYSDNRHPDAVTFVSRVEEDLARRDFTINAMAWSPREGLQDPFGGREDLRNGILRAVGDSTRPLYFLIFSALMNTGLDLLFVAVLKLGIAGAAIATILSQFVSALLVMLLLLRSKEPYRLRPDQLRISPCMLRRICNIGIPSSLQMGVTAFSNVFVLGYINHFESSCMAGWTAYNKLDALAMLPMQSLSLALAMAEHMLLDKDGAWRIHGGGFAGTVQAFVPLDLVPAFRENVERILGANSCHVMVIRPVGGIWVA